MFKLSKVLIFIAAGLVAFSCREKKGEPGAQEEVKTSTSKPVQVDPMTDNKMVLESLRPGVAFQLVVTDDEVRLENFFIGRLPAGKSGQDNAGELEVSVMGANKTLGTTKVMDEPMMVQENEGMVKLKERRVFGVIYISQKADSLTIKRADRKDQSFDLKEYYVKFCRENQKDSLCQ